MRILFLNPTGQLGGAEMALLELLAGLREAQPSWSLRLLAASDGPLVARAAALGVKAQVLPFPPTLARIGEWGCRDHFTSRVALAVSCARAAKPTYTYLRLLRELTRELAPDVMHTNGLKMHVLGAWARPATTSLVWHLHDYVGRRPFSARLLRHFARRCSAIVANSDSVADDIRETFPRAPEIYPAWNAVDLNQFSPIGPKLDLDELSGLPPASDDVVHVGLVATFARWKGQQTFLEALATLPRSLPVRGFVIGGPVYDTDRSQFSLDELRATSAALGLASRVGFTGLVPDSAAAIRALDIVVHASTEPEPFGLVIAEAMACAKPVIVSQSGGAADLVTAGVDALAYPAGDVPALASCIGKLVGDQALRRAIGRAGRATAERCFTRRRLAAELIPVYQRLAAGLTTVVPLQIPAGTGHVSARYRDDNRRES